MTLKNIVHADTAQTELKTKLFLCENIWVKSNTEARSSRDTNRCLFLYKHEWTASKATSECTGCKFHTHRGKRCYHMRGECIKLHVCICCEFELLI